jgi:glyoxylase-like metal-dependent hydrolase (beta-lactamase superfamily II)
LGRGVAGIAAVLTPLIIAQNGRGASPRRLGGAPRPLQRAAAFAKMTSVSLRIETFIIGHMPNNLYLLIDESAREAAVVDPSFSSESALQRMRELQAAGIMLKAIWNTHGHLDHVHDNAVWKDAFDVPVLMHPADLIYIEGMQEQAKSFSLDIPPRAVRPDADLSEGQLLKVGSHEIEVMHLPGHSPGSVAFYSRDENTCLVGDVLLKGTIARIDLPGHNTPLLCASLLRLAQLPPVTRILTGHGDETTIAIELATNHHMKSLAVPSRKSTE